MSIECHCLAFTDSHVVEKNSYVAILIQKVQIKYSALYVCTYIHSYIHLYICTCHFFVQYELCNGFFIVLASFRYCKTRIQRFRRINLLTIQLQSWGIFKTFFAFLYFFSRQTFEYLPIFKITKKFDL